VAQKKAIRAQVSAGNGNSINQLSYQNTLNNSIWSVFEHVAINSIYF